MSFCLCVCVARRLCPSVFDCVRDSALASRFTLPLSPDTHQLPAWFTARNSFPSLPTVWIPKGPAACPKSSPCGLWSRPDLDSDTLWKAPNMLLFWSCTQRSCSGGEGQGRKGVGGSWQHPPILLERELSLWPCPRPHFSSPCSHPVQVFRVLASLSWDGNEQSSANPARPVRDLVLCVPQHLTCQH